MFLGIGEHVALESGKDESILILGSARYINSLDLDAVPRIRVGEAIAQFVISARNLGILITPTLNWRETVTRYIN